MQTYQVVPNLGRSLADALLQPVTSAGGPSSKVRASVTTTLLLLAVVVAVIVSSVRIGVRVRIERGVVVAEGRLVVVVRRVVAERVVIGVAIPPAPIRVRIVVVRTVGVGVGVVGAVRVVVRGGVVGVIV